MAAKKRVACYYRVSTYGQVEGGKDGKNIPMQKNKCHEFTNNNGWEIVEEYTELGVSGYKVNPNNRDEMKRLINDAQKGKFDIVLCYHTDRLGRKGKYFSLLIEWFHKQGIEIWSTMEGQKKFDDHNDSLLNYITGWLNEGESIKTSMRVNESHRQMVKQGLYRGGTPPFGYKLEPSGKFNKKQKELMKMVIDDDESKVIKIIFNLVYEKQYGSNRIAKYLNENSFKKENYRPNNTSLWSASSINTILRNPVYKGYITYGKRKYENEAYHHQQREDWILSDTQNKDIMIVEENVFDEVQKLRSSRTPAKVKDESIETRVVTKSPLLLVGMIRCGHCGATLTTTYNTKVYKRKDGTVNKKREPKYRCSGKALNRTNCDGQTIYSHRKIEGIVLDRINDHLKQLQKVDFTKQINQFKKDHMKESEKEKKRKEKELKESENELASLRSEVVKAISGKSHFTPDLLNSLISEKEEKIESVKNELNDMESNLDDKEVEVVRLKKLEKVISDWEELFEKADHEEKKGILSQFIKGVTVHRDKVRVEFNSEIESILS